MVEKKSTNIPDCICGEPAVCGRSPTEGLCAKHLVEALLAKFALQDMHCTDEETEDWILVVFDSLWTQMEDASIPFSRN